MCVVVRERLQYFKGWSSKSDLKEERSQQVLMWVKSIPSRGNRWCRSLKQNYIQGPSNRPLWLEWSEKEE